MLTAVLIYSVLSSSSSLTVRSLEVKVGIDELLDVTVSVENREENSYNSHVALTYPVGLSYRKFTTLQVRHQDLVCLS